MIWLGARRCRTWGRVPEKEPSGAWSVTPGPALHNRIAPVVERAGTLLCANEGVLFCMEDGTWRFPVAQREPSLVLPAKAATPRHDQEGRQLLVFAAMCCWPCSSGPSSCISGIRLAELVGLPGPHGPRDLLQGLAADALPYAYHQVIHRTITAETL